MHKMYVWLFKKIAGGFVNKIAPGKKTFIVGFLTFITGLLGVLGDGKAYEFLCGYAAFFCNFNQSEFYSEILTIVGILVQILTGGRAYDSLVRKEPLDPTYQ
jgi:hypothetical protein